jgi:hypothetical protein
MRVMPELRARIDAERRGSSAFEIQSLEAFPWAGQADPRKWRSW